MRFDWYERTPGAIDGGVPKRFHQNGPSQLYRLFLMQQQPQKPVKHRPPTKLRVTLNKIAEFRQRQEDAADVLSGKKIAVTQEEWDRAND